MDYVVTGIPVMHAPNQLLRNRLVRSLLDVGYRPASAVCVPSSNQYPRKDRGLGHQNRFQEKGHFLDIQLLPDSRFFSAGLRKLV